MQAVNSLFLKPAISAASGVTSWISSFRRPKPCDEKEVAVANSLIEMGKPSYFVNQAIFPVPIMGHDEEIRVSSLRGETGLVPTLHLDYQLLLHLPLLTSKLTGCSARAVSTAWARIWKQFWEENKGRESLLTFEWGAQRSSSERVVVKNVCTPIEFELISSTSSSTATTTASAAGASNNSGGAAAMMKSDEKGASEWKIVAGYSNGCCFRESADHLDEEWRRLAPCNVFWCQMTAVQSDAAPMYMLRHSLLGFEDDISNNTAWAKQLLQYAIIKQEESHLPARLILTVLTQKTDDHLYQEEIALAQRQQSCYNQGMMNLNNERTCQNRMPVGFAVLTLPLVTDQIFYGVPDYNRSENITCFVQYLKWITNDAMQGIARLMLSVDAYRVFVDANQLSYADPRYEPMGEADGELCREMQRCKKLNKHTILKYLTEDQVDPEMRDALSALVTRAGNDTVWSSTCKGIMSFVAAKKFDTTDCSAVKSGIDSILITLWRFIQLFVGFAKDFPNYSECHVIKHLERSAISCNLLHSLLSSELVSKVEVTQEEKSGGGSARRTFNRISSVGIVSLLNVCLGVCPIVTCDSGLDRTGIFCSIQSGYFNIWKLHPKLRWPLHLTAINYNLIRGRVGDGYVGFSQPFPTQFSTDISMSESFENYFRHPPQTLFGFNRPPSAAHCTHPDCDGAIEVVRLWRHAILLDGESERLKELLPIFSVLRNFIFIYAVEINGRLSFASSGVRGLKYNDLPLMGQTIPNGVLDGRGNLEHLVSKQISGLKQFAGSTKLSMEALTKIGKQLLCDAVVYRP